MIRLKSLITEAESDKFVPMGPKGKDGFQKGKWGWMRYKGAEIYFEREGRHAGSPRYKAKLVKGKWPTDDELIALADGRPSPSRWGGKVTNYVGGNKQVEVWTS